MRRTRPGPIDSPLARALAIALGVAAAGCFSDRGAAIEIDVGDTGATSVELYLGKLPCTTGDNTANIDCTGIAPPDGKVLLRGDVWFRDDLLPYTAAVNGRTATFQLKADTADTLPILIAVGLVTSDQGVRAVGTATLHDVAIPIHSARIVTTMLAGANPVQPKTDPKDLTEDRVLVWTKQLPASSCVVVEHWQHGEVTRDFVVPIEDPDCDDVKLECNPAAYHGTSTAGASIRPDCFADAAAGACMLGSLGCSDDGGPKTGSCTAQRNQVCVPRMFCSCTSLEDSCTRDQLDDAGTTIPRIDCDVPAHLVALGVDVCPGIDRTTIALDMFYPGGKCEQPLLTSLLLGGFATSHDFGGAVMELGSPAQPCSFPITWKSGTRTQAAPTDDHGLIRLQTANGGSLLVPVVLHFVAGTCLPGDKFSCAFKGDVNDTLWSCAP